MAFFKENVALFLKDHADELPLEAITLAKEELDKLLDGEMMMAGQANSFFGNEVVAHWFLYEIESSRKHMELALTIKAKGQ